uniref:Uncharacterized protein n=2 Tax=Cyprinus carpio TaxID=7962 RepID=A0A8C1DL35_CYPCA
MNLKNIRNLYDNEFYFCSEVCSWSDVKAYYGTGAWGVDERFKIDIVLSLENDTAHALGLITEELKKMREAVVQNRLVLDLLTSQQGGVCKMLGVSCCFYIPDNSDNITNIVSHILIYSDAYLQKCNVY